MALSALAIAALFIGQALGSFETPGSSEALGSFEALGNAEPTPPNICDLGESDLEPSDAEKPKTRCQYFTPELMVPIWPNGTMEKLKGTVEQIVQQAVEMNPKWIETYMDSDGTTPTKRAIFPEGSQSCYHNQPDIDSARVQKIQDGIDYLRRVPGIPQNGAGPNNCGRVSCSYGAAIYWCNDDTSVKEIDSFGSIADGADLVVRKCPKTSRWMTTYTKGEARHSDNWRVVVKGEDC